MSEYQHIQVRVDESIAHLIFNRPDQLNAMNRLMMDEIVDAIYAINSDDQIKVGVIQGQGRAFMAGADIKEYGNQSLEEFKAFQQKGWQLYEGLEKASIPWVAAVNGYALGGGCEIALACDMIIATEGSSFGLPEVHLSLLPGGGGTQRLIQKTGVNRTKEMLFLGGQFTADEMKKWGIVNCVFESAHFEKELMRIVKKLSRRSTRSISAMKKLVHLSMTSESLADGLQQEGKALEELFLSQEAQDAIQAFIVKNAN